MVSCVVLRTDLKTEEPRQGDASQGICAASKVIAACSAVSANSVVLTLTRPLQKFQLRECECRREKGRAGLLCTTGLH